MKAIISRDMFVSLLISCIISHVLGQHHKQTMSAEQKSQTNKYDSLHRRIHPHREEPNVFIVGLSQFDTESPTPAPTTAVPRVYNYRSCERGSSTLEGEEHTHDYVAEIDFVYDVETNVQGLNMGEQETIGSDASSEMMDRLFDTHCKGKKRRLGVGDVLSRQLLVESISAGRKDTPIGSCNVDSTNTESQSCTRFDGSIVIGYNDHEEDATKQDVGTSILDQIREDMENGFYTDAINKQMNDQIVKITAVRFVSTDFYSTNGINALQGQQYFVADTGGLNLLGKSMMALIGLIFFCLLIVCCQWRKLLAREEKRENHTIASSDDGEDLDPIYLVDDKYVSDSKEREEAGECNDDRQFVSPPPRHESTSRETQFTFCDRSGPLSPISELSGLDGVFRKKHDDDDEHDEHDDEHDDSPSNLCCNKNPKTRTSSNNSGTEGVGRSGDGTFTGYWKVDPVMRSGNQVDYLKSGSSGEVRDSSGRMTDEVEL